MATSEESRRDGWRWAGGLELEPRRGRASFIAAAAGPPSLSRGPEQPARGGASPPGGSARAPQLHPPAPAGAVGGRGEAPRSAPAPRALKAPQSRDKLLHGPRALSRGPSVGAAGPPRGERPRPQAPEPQSLSPGTTPHSSSTPELPSPASVLAEARPGRAEASRFC